MPWTAITADDVLTEFTPVEQATLNGIQGASDGLDTILARVVKRMRGQIKAGSNELDQSGETIPDQLFEEVIAIARWKWLASFPALKSLKTDERKQAAKDAESLMREIASNDPNRPRVELPPVPDTTAAPTDATQVVSKSKREMTRKKLSGLI